MHFHIIIIIVIVTVTVTVTVTVIVIVIKGKLNSKWFSLAFFMFSGKLLKSRIVRSQKLD